MNKVYIVTSGTYSDYAIEEVFDNREDAEKYICLHDNDSYLDMRVEEYDIYKNAELKNVKFITVFILLCVKMESTFLILYTTTNLLKQILIDLNITIQKVTMVHCRYPIEIFLKIKML